MSITSITEAERIEIRDACLTAAQEMQQVVQSGATPRDDIAEAVQPSLQAAMDALGLVAQAPDTVLRDDLADTTDPDNGAGLIGFNPALSYTAGSVGAAVQGLYARIPSVLDYGAVGDGITDDTATIQLAIDSTTGPLSLGDLGLTFKVSRLVFKAYTRLVGRGTLNYSGNATYASTVADPLIKAFGSAGTPTLCTVDVVKGAKTLTVASTTGIVAGDIVEISTPGTNGGFIDSSIAVHNGEVCKVLSVASGTSLVLVDPIIDETGYAVSANAQVRKINTLKGIGIGKQITIVGKGRPVTGVGGNVPGDNGLVLMYCEDSDIQCAFRQVDLAAVRWEGCYNCEATDGSAIMDAKGNNDAVNYGYVYSGSSKHIRIRRNSMANMRHGVVSSHLSTALGLGTLGVSRCVDVDDNIIINTWHAAIATHNDTDVVNLRRNNIFGCAFGINVRERNVLVEGGTIGGGTVQCIYLSGHPRDITVRNVVCRDYTGSLLTTDFDTVQHVRNITVEGCEGRRGAGGITMSFPVIAGAPDVPRNITLKRQRFYSIVGAGGNQALLRVTGAQPPSDLTIGNNEAYECTNIGGVRVDGGATRYFAFGNEMKGVSGLSYATVGTFTTSYGKGNVGTSWSGSSAMTNTATFVADNTFF